MLGDQAGPLFLHTGQGCTLATVDVGHPSNTYAYIPDRFGFVLTYVRLCEVGGTVHNNDGVVGANMFAVWNSASTDSWGIGVSLYLHTRFILIYNRYSHNLFTD